MPSLSIIIPTFNSAATIGRCLESIAVQTFTDYEVIVQDASPSDDTAQTIERFQETHANFRVRLFREPDCGTYDAMNKGVRKASGEWLYFLGSDDELFGGGVLATLMATENTAGCDVIYGNVQSVGDSKWGNSGTIYDGKFDLGKLLNRNICHQAIFYRAEFGRQIGEYNTEFALCADWDFNLRCWARTNFKYVDITAAKYCMGGISDSGKPDEAFLGKFIANVMCYFHLSLLSPLLNSADFWGVYDVIEMQKAKGPIYSLAGKALRRLLNIRAKLEIG